ncbi:MAG: coniferyl-alcohol dehydrogenase [Acidimicrobiia bacterium]|nr:coniferyl-alcohol dehydrogenase [Acidimicrobiia bacterium]
MTTFKTERRQRPLLDFSDRTVVVTGTASGIGAATVDLLTLAGADVHALDIAYPASDRIPGGDTSSVTAHQCDLGSRSSIDAALAALPPAVDVLMNCAGVPNGGRFDVDQVMTVNWFGLRHLTENLLERMPNGSSVVHVASTAGRAWGDRVELHQSLMAARSFDEGMAWLADNRHLCGDGYVVSKEAVQYYTLWRAVQLLPRDIRMNSVCPGITATGLVDDFRKGMGPDVIDHAAAVAGRFAQPWEMAPAMLFLADQASASYLNGVNLNIDRGTGAARLTNQSDPERIWGRR